MLWGVDKSWAGLCPFLLGNQDRKEQVPSLASVIDS